MARDTRGNSAFDSGMRGREKPKVNAAHGKTATNDNAGGESSQAPGKTIGEPGGVSLNDSAYSSGMRGMEKAKQKSAGGDAVKQPSGAEQPEGHQKPHSTVGSPEGHNDAGKGPRKGVTDDALQSATAGAHKMGIPGNNTEMAADGKEPYGDGILGEEDDTHINIRIPKASLKKKDAGLNTN